MDLKLIGVRYNVSWSDDTQPAWYVWEVKKIIKNKYFVSIDDGTPVAYTIDEFPDVVERFDWRK